MAPRYVMLWAGQGDKPKVKGAVRGLRKSPSLPRLLPPPLFFYPHLLSISSLSFSLLHSLLLSSLSSPVSPTVFFLLLLYSPPFTFSPAHLLQSTSSFLSSTSPTLLPVSPCPLFLPSLLHLSPSPLFSTLPPPSVPLFPPLLLFSPSSPSFYPSSCLPLPLLSTPPSFYPSSSCLPPPSSPFFLPSTCPPPPHLSSSSAPSSPLPDGHLRVPTRNTHIPFSLSSYLGIPSGRRMHGGDSRLPLY